MPLSSWINLYVLFRIVFPSLAGAGLLKTSAKTQSRTSRDVFFKIGKRLLLSTGFELGIWDAHWPCPNSSKMVANKSVVCTNASLVLFGDLTEGPEIIIGTCKPPWYTLPFAGLDWATRESSPLSPIKIISVFDHKLYTVSESNRRPISWSIASFMAL